MIRFVLAVFLLAQLVSAQDILAYTEFQQLDPEGNPANRPAGTEPREVLSPGVARNGYASYRLVVYPPAASTAYRLEVGLNPDDAVRVTLYREILEQKDGKWTTTKLEPIPHPYDFKPAADATSKVHHYWLDIFVPANAPVDRIKVQPEIMVDDKWYEYPMEVRILEARYPALPPQTEQNRALSGASGLDVICTALGVAGKGDGAPAPMTPEWMIRRNLYQDALYLRNRTLVAKRNLLNTFGAKTPEDACKILRTAADPEHYLAFRDLLIGALE